jgi:predicted dithiol-disulfide oxidoreductase (DUF899 family)
MEEGGCPVAGRGGGTVDHQVVLRAEWLAAREAFLVKEKAFTRERDELGRERRALPWERVETSYVFEEPSAFIRSEDGSVLHTYSCGARGIDMLTGAYHYLDIAPKGRDENPDATQDWVRHHDRYED